MGKISKRKGYPGGIYLDECSAGITVRNNRIENVACDYYYHDTECLEYLKQTNLM